MIKKTKYLFFILLLLFSCNRNLTLDDLPENDRLQEMVNDMEEEILVLEDEIVALESFYRQILINKDSLLLISDRS
ncbi:hypothetical protein, partial [Algoriphagus sp.]|uniref:hypothetical protein n=1 Tax=Algoriphagus sp. TaxID=1872435 RepID=UPI0025D402F0